MADAISRQAPSRRTLLRTMPVVQLIGLIVVTVVVAFGSVDAYHANVPVDASEATLTTLVGRSARVACTGPIVYPGLEIATEDGEDGDVEYVALCPFGGRSLVVVSDAPIVPRQLAGTLQPATGDELWLKPIRERAGELGPVDAAAYLDLTTGAEDRVVLWLVVVLGLGGAAGWVLFARRMLRRRQAA